MIKQELEQKILDYIREKYKVYYTGLLEVVKNDSEYSLIIGIPSYMIPTTISGTFLSDELFLNYVYEELRTRNYMRLDIYKVIRCENSREE